MTKYHRFLVIVAIGMAMTILISAGRQGPRGTGPVAPLVAESGATIEFTYWQGSPSEINGWNYVIERFRREHPNITLRAQYYPPATYRDIVATRMAANDWPDAIRDQYQRMGRFKTAGVMLDLTDAISQESQNDLVPAFRQAMMHEGRLLGMPHHTDTMGVFYNRRMFEQSGIRIPQHARDGWTWEELTQIAARLRADHRLDFAFGGIWENGNGHRFMPFMYAAGGRVLSPDGTRVVINSPENLRAIELYENWRRNDLVFRNGFTQPFQANNLFAAQQMAFVFAGSWHMSFMDEHLGDNWGLTYMPQINGRSGSDMGGNGLFGYAGTRFPHATAIFLDWITSRDVMRGFCEVANFIPVRQSLINQGLNYRNHPAGMQTFLNIAATIDPNMAADQTSSHFIQLNAIFSEEMDPLVIDGSATARQVLERMERRMTAALRE